MERCTEYSVLTIDRCISLGIDNSNINLYKKESCSSSLVPLKIFFQFHNLLGNPIIEELVGAFPPPFLMDALESLLIIALSGELGIPAGSQLFPWDWSICAVSTVEKILLGVGRV